MRETGSKSPRGDQGRSPVKSLMLDPLCIILQVSDPVSVSVGECERSCSASFNEAGFLSSCREGKQRDSATGRGVQSCRESECANAAPSRRGVFM